MVNPEPARCQADTDALRQEVITACQYLARLGYFVGTWGNISVRLDEGFMVTPSALPYDTLVTGDMVVVRWDGGGILKGHRVPSSETELHRQLLCARPDLGAIVHTHSPYASTLSCTREGIPVCVEDMAQIIGGEVQCAPYVPGSDHVDLARAACAAMGPECVAVLLSNHGPVIGGRTLAEAVTASEILEKAAMMTVLSRGFGGATSIPGESVNRERHRYLYKYGRAADGAIAAGGAS